MNRTIKDPTVECFHYESHDQIRAHLADFMAAYNLGRPLKAFGSLTPYEYTAKIRVSETVSKVCRVGSAVIFRRHFVANARRCRRHPLRFAPRERRKIPRRSSAGDFRNSLSEPDRFIVSPIHQMLGLNT